MPNNLDLEKTPVEGRKGFRGRLEPKDPLPLTRGRCSWCGAKVKGKFYCSPDHRTKYNNLQNAQGKAIIQIAKVWRKHRGRKGTPGEGLIGELTDRLDKLNAEDRDRWRSFGN